MELVASRSVVELELRRALASRRSNPKNTVLLLRAAPQWHGETEFSVEDKGRQVPVTVAPCATVLAVLDALAADRPDGQLPGRPHSVRTPARSATRCSPGRCSRRSSRSTAGTW